MHAAHQLMPYGPLPGEDDPFWPADQREGGRYGDQSQDDVDSSTHTWSGGEIDTGTNDDDWLNTNEDPWGE